MLEQELAFPQQTSIEETVKEAAQPELKPVPEFDTEELTLLLEEHISDPERVAFLVSMAETLPLSTAEELERMTDSQDPYEVDAAIVLTPVILERCVETEVLEPALIDSIRDTLGRQMTHQDLESRRLAQEIYIREKPRLKERDETTYSRIGWLAVDKRSGKKWGASDDYMQKARTGRTRQPEYIYDDNGSPTGIKSWY